MHALPHPENRQQNRLPVARCYQGFSEDRRSPGGIAARNEDTLKGLAAVKPLALDLGVKIAIEYHAGDMQGWELARLIEQAGPEFVGATIDPGNATWTLEDPMDNLEALGPHILCSGIRNSVVWETGEGAQSAWTSPGEGLIDMKAYAKRFFELAPDAPFIVETILLNADEIDRGLRAECKRAAGVMILKAFSPVVSRSSRDNGARDRRQALGHTQHRVPQARPSILRPHSSPYPTRQKRFGSEVWDWNDRCSLGPAWPLEFPDANTS